MPVNTFVVGLRRSLFDKATEHAAVRWVGELEPRHKVHGILSTIVTDQRLVGTDDFFSGET